MAEGNPRDDTQTGEPGRGKEKTAFGQFDDLMTKLLAVPKKELDEQRAKYRRERKEKRAG